MLQIVLYYLVCCTTIPVQLILLIYKAGVLDACNEFGYGLVIHPCENNSPDLLSKLRNLLASSRVDGLVLTPPMTENRQLIDFLDSNSIPYVLITPLNLEQFCPLVSIDDVLAARQSIQHLIDFGHKRIGLILGARERSGTEMRLLGYQQALGK